MVIFELIIASITITGTLLGIYLLLRKFGNSLVKSFANDIQELFVSPTVKRGFSLMGKLGGEAYAGKELSKDLLKGAITQNYGAIKMFLEKATGFNLDDIIDEYGVGAIMQALQQFGIDPSKLLSGEIDINQLLGGKGLNSTKTYSYGSER